MKQTLLLLACLHYWCAFAQQTYLQVYGTVQIDINRGNDLLQLDDSTFVIGGEWNNTGYLARVDYKGTLLDYFFLDGTIPGNSRVLDLVQDLVGNVIAVGECDHCASGDTTTRIFAVAVEPSLLFINSAIYEGSNPTDRSIKKPRITSKGNQLVIAATQGGSGLNFTDVRLLGITSNLNVTWSKVYNSCSNCGFDDLRGLVTTLNGFGILVGNPFTDSITLYTVNDTGAVILKKRYEEPAGTQALALAYRLGAFYVGGHVTLAGHTEGVIWRLGETDGSLIGTFPVNVPDVDGSVAGLQLANDDMLLAIHHRSEPNSLGTYIVSRIYRLDPASGTIGGYTEIPNPDVFTNMVANAVIPLNLEGTELAAVGTRGFYNRTFFFSVNSLEPAPPGQVFTLSTDTACGPALISVNNHLDNATTYQWYLDGQLVSTKKQPDPFLIEEAGVHEVKLTASTATGNKIQNFVVTSLPEVWNECIICDNKPDPYVVIKSVSGAILYTSGWVEAYPPVSLPVSFTMNVNQTYRLEVWDKDNIGADDFFGAFTIPGNTTGGAFSTNHPDDPAHPLTILFSTQLQTQSTTHVDTVVVYRPTVVLTADTLLVAQPNAPVPASYTWQWYLNGQPILGANGDTLVPSGGGAYAVAMITDQCTAISDPVFFATPLTGLQISAISPKCHGESNGEIHVEPIGGLPPYDYGWKPPILTGSDPTGLAAGTYNLTVTDANGNTATASIQLIDPDPLTLELEGHDLSCHGDLSGYMVVQAAGGTGDYTYAWDNPSAQGPNPIYLPAGSYTLTLTDQNGCTAIDSVTLSEPPPLVLTVSSTPEIANQSPGTATVSVSGGTPPYSYSWSDSMMQTTSTATGLSAGTYTVTVMDANGCPAVEVVVVELVNSAAELELAGGLLLWPNPADGVLHLEAAVEDSRRYDMHLLTPEGQLVRGWRAVKLPAVLDLGDLPAGMYFIRIFDDSGALTRKVLLQP
ncbi:MAG: hypothetical protein KatS3mg030_598 [Saprospiraceae bacterium]|nr:MAG: hypothetical protein KatS3mg030_598 [Saprospiraceae bacterium]